ncbi:MAG: HNH endonuclease, partial [Azonexus sp.]|nr:HNH endonuclease [Azonexus sp.]
MKVINHNRLDKVVSDARKAADTRAEGYRERALKLYPWICGRCTREFTQ